MAGSNLPPWKAHSPRHRERMRAWVNAELDAQEAAFHRRLVSEVANYTRLLGERLSHLDDGEKSRRKERGLAKTQEWLRELALQQAEQGNLEPLRKLHPGLARFINKPLLKRGEHFGKKLSDDPVALRCRLEEALAELPRVRAIWKKHYGKTNRQGGQLTAEEIVAARWGLDEEEVRKRRLSQGRYR